MKHASNPRRGRGRNSGKRNQNSRNRNFESSGSDQKVRGTAQQVLDKYLALARDASSSGDRIAAEGFFQHAEHYYRIINAEGAQGDGQNDRKRHDNRGNRHNESRGKPEKPAAAAEQPAKEESSTEPVKEVTEAPVKEMKAETKEEAPAEEKPRRRGRPRKAEAAEPASDDKGASETAA